MAWFHSRLYSYHAMVTRVQKRVDLHWCIWRTHGLHSQCTSRWDIKSSWRSKIKSMFNSSPESKDQHCAGLAYGYLAGVPPIHGLYTSIFLSLIYVIFGSSKHAAPGGKKTTVIHRYRNSGAFAIISMMVGTVVEDVLSPPDMDSHEITTGFCCSPKATGGEITVGWIR